MNERDDLVARLRRTAGDPMLSTGCPSPDAAILREAADALATAREENERLRGLIGWAMNCAQEAEFPSDIEPIVLAYRAALAGADDPRDPEQQLDATIRIEVVRQRADESEAERDAARVEVAALRGLLQEATDLLKRLHRGDHRQRANSSLCDYCGSHWPCDEKEALDLAARLDALLSDTTDTTGEAT